MRDRKVSIIINLGINPSSGGIPPKLSIGMTKFVVIICLLGCRVLELVLLSNKIAVITTVE